MRKIENQACPSEASALEPDPGEASAGEASDRNKLKQQNPGADNMIVSSNLSMFAFGKDSTNSQDAILKPPYCIPKFLCSLNFVCLLRTTHG